MERIGSAGLIYPETAVAIARLESGGFTSKLFREGNNPFAFKRNSRPFCKETDAKGYCRYRTLDDALADYVAYERQVIAKYGLTTEAEYRRHIIRNYAADPRYGAKLAKHLKMSKTTGLE